MDSYLRGEMKSVEIKKEDQGYESGEVELTEQYDKYIRTTTHKVRKND